MAPEPRSGASVVLICAGSVRLLHVAKRGSFDALAALTGNVDRTTCVRIWFDDLSRKLDALLESLRPRLTALQALYDLKC